MALKETQNLLHKAKQDERDARRVIRETGREREVAVEAEASQRSIIRELTQRAAQLGRDKAELVDERDALRERIRGLKTSLSRYPDEPGVASTRPPLRSRDSRTQPSPPSDARASIVSPSASRLPARSMQIRRSDTRISASTDSSSCGASAT